jgi:hypothetical protein
MLQYGAPATSILLIHPVSTSIIPTEMTARITHEHGGWILRLLSGFEELFLKKVDDFPIAAGRMIVIAPTSADRRRRRRRPRR